LIFVQQQMDPGFAGMTDKFIRQASTENRSADGN
jgi:hypothetical protein